MDLQTLAALGEFIGGIGGFIAAVAVVASLIFVGMPIRASNRQARVVGYAGVTSLWGDFANSGGANVEAWAIV